MIRLHAADPLDFRLRHRLLVRNDGEGLQHHIRQHRLLGVAHHPDQGIIAKGIGAQLIGRLHTADQHAPLPRFIFLQETLRRGPGQHLISIQCRRQLRQTHRPPHGEEQRLHNALLLFQFRGMLPVNFQTERSVFGFQLHQSNSSSPCRSRSSSFISSTTCMSMSPKGCSWVRVMCPCFMSSSTARKLTTTSIFWCFFRSIC